MEWVEDWKCGKGGELWICPIVDGDGLASLGEKGKVETVHCCQSFVFRFWPVADEEPWARKACKYMTNFLTSDIYFLLSKDQTNYYDQNQYDKALAHSTNGLEVWKCDVGVIDKWNIWTLFRVELFAELIWFKIKITGIQGSVHE